MRTLIACVLLSTVLGSIHAYSLFIDPFEADLDAGRGAVSSVYSLALVTLTLAVLVGHPLFRILPPRLVAFGAAVGAALGLMLASVASSLPLVLVGYGLVFGGANGIGYAFSLQTAAEANPERRAFAMGLVTAVYALGATGGAILLDDRIDAAGAPAALRSLALIILAAGLVVVVLLPRELTSSHAADKPNSSALDGQLLVRMWAAYGLAVFAGLMALGHTAAIVAEAGNPDSLGARTIVVAGLANAIGGAGIALIAGRASVRRWLIGLPVASAVTLVALAAAPSGGAALIGVSAVAFVYGAIIALYPFAVSKTFGDDLYPLAYGRVFIAWGLAGLIGPIGAGAIFDATGSYAVPLLIAAVAALGSASVARGLHLGALPVMKR